MTKDDQTALALLKEMLEAQLIRRNPEEAASHLAQNFHWFGFGLSSDVYDRKSALDALQWEVQHIDAPLKLEYHDERLLDMGGGSAAELNLVVTGSGFTANYRVTALAQEGQLCSIHLSSAEKPPIGIFPFVKQAPDTEANTLTFREQERFASSITEIPGGIMIYRLTEGYPIVYVNDTLLRHLGYENRAQFLQAVGGLALGTVHPDERETVSYFLKRQLNGVNGYKLTYRLLKRNGGYIWVDEYGKPMQTDSGETLLVCLMYDISLRREAEEKLKENEQRYRLAINGANIAVWEYDIPHHRIIQTDDLRRNHYPGTIIENVPESVIALAEIHPDQQEQVRDIFRRIEAGETNVTGDFWVSNIRTHTRWCERVFYSTVFDKNGKPIKAYGASIDVTAEKIAEKRYQQELSYRQSVAKSIVSCAQVNLTTGMVETIHIDDRELLDGTPVVFTDYREHTLRVLNENHMTDEQNRRLMPPALIDAFNHGTESVSEEYLARNKTGHYIWLRTDVNLIKQPDTGDILAFYYHRNMTPQILRSNVFETIFNKNFEEVGILDLRTGIYQKIGGNSRQSPPDSEFPFEDGVIRGAGKWVVPEERARIIELLQIERIRQEVSKDRLYNIPYRALSEDGTPFYDLMRFQVLKNDANTLLFTRANIDTMVLADQDKQRRLEKAIEEAQRANAAKSDFLSRMSHEIRTPMNAILGISALGLDEADEPETMRTYFREISESGTYLLGLINDILDMSRIERGQFELHEELVDGPAFLSGIQNMLEPLAQSKGIRLITDFSEAQTPWVYMDKMRSQQIYVNLLNNAIKFSDPGGTIEWTVADRIVGPDQMRMVSTIRDYGRGMSEEFQKRVFTPFAQEDRKDGGERKGTGLGLAIVKNLIDNMGGTISFTSQVGIGTTFTFELARRVLLSKPSDNNSQSPDKTPGLNGKTVLLCEDHPLNTQIAVKLLKKKGVSVLCAENGKEGLERFAASRPGEIQAILMDIQMPIMDGLEAAAAIRALNRPDAGTIPILAMSANAFDTDVQKSLEAGMNAHLSKPINPQKMYETLAEFLA